MMRALIASAMLVAAPALAAPAPLLPPAQSAAFSFAGPLQQGAIVVGTAPAGTVSLALDGKPVPLAPDGHFLIGFDRDAGPAALLVAKMADGREVPQTLAVAPRAWKIEHVDVAKHPSMPSAEFEKLRAPEIQRINAARAVNAPSDGWREQFIWPAKGRISGLFGSQRIYRGEPGAYHAGVDIAGGAGATVVAPADGVVVLVADKPFTLEGNLLIIDHGMGLNSAFLHLSEIDVHEGDRVHKGQVIGKIGMTGRATGPHLHWAIKWRAARVDPMTLTGPMPGQDLSKVPVTEN